MSALGADPPPPPHDGGPGGDRLGGCGAAKVSDEDDSSVESVNKVVKIVDKEARQRVNKIIKSTKKVRRITDKRLNKLENACNEQAGELFDLQAQANEQGHQITEVVAEQARLGAEQKRQNSAQQATRTRVDFYAAGFWLLLALVITLFRLFYENKGA